MPTYLYWGDEDFNLELAIKRLREKVLEPDWVTFNHKILDNPSIQAIIEAVSTMPMGPGGVLVEVHNLNLFSRKTKKGDDADEGKKDPRDERDLKELLELIPELPERVSLLFVVPFPRDAKRKIDKSLKTSKTIDKYGVIQHFEAFSPFQPDKVIKWIKEAATELNVKITPDAAQKLYECTGTELRKINSELKKLATYKLKEKTITIDDVIALCSGIDNVFVLADKWVQGEKHDALIELKKILDKDHPIRVIATLQSVISEYLHIKLALKFGHKSTQLSEEIGMHPYRLSKTIEKLRRITPERLNHLRTQLTNYENKIKTGQLKPELAMEILMTM